MKKLIVIVASLVLMVCLSGPVKAAEDNNVLEVTMLDLTSASFSYVTSLTNPYYTSTKSAIVSKSSFGAGRMYGSQGVLFYITENWVGPLKALFITVQNSPDGTDWINVFSMDTTGVAISSQSPLSHYMPGSTVRYGPYWRLSMSNRNTNGANVSAVVKAFFFNTD